MTIETTLSKTTGTCPICDESHRDYLFVVHGMRLSRCRGCGFVSADAVRELVKAETLGPQASSPTVPFDKSAEQIAAGHYLRDLRLLRPTGNRLLLLAEPGHPAGLEASIAGFTEVTQVSAADWEKGSITPAISHKSDLLLLRCLLEKKTSESQCNYPLARWGACGLQWDIKKETDMRIVTALFFVLLTTLFGIPTDAATNRLLSLNGASGYASVPDSVDLRLSQTDFTMGCWVRLESYRTAGSAIMAKRSAGTGNGWILWVGGTSLAVGEARKVFFNVADATDPRVVGASDLPLGEWHHVAVSYRLATSNALLYIDGQPNGQAQILSPHSASNALFIGQDTLGSSYYFDGAIDDVQIWARSLNQSEIRSMMDVSPIGTESNLVAYWNFDNGTVFDAAPKSHAGAFVGGATTDADTKAVTNSIHIAVEVPFVSGSPLTRYQLQYTTNILTGPWLDSGTPVSGNGRELCLFDGPRGDSPRFYRVVSVYPSLTDGLVAYYPFNGNANDMSGNQMDCAVSGAILAPDRNGATNSAYEFNGANACLTTPVTLRGFTAFTVAGWFYARSYEQAGKYPIQFCQAVNAARAVLMVGGTGNLALLAADGDSAPLQTLVTSSRVLLPLNTWHHITATFDSVSDSHAIYVDGIKAAENHLDMGPLPDTAPFHAATIGVNYSPTPAHQRWWNGFIDDVRIYDRALTSTEVRELYSLTP